MSEKPDLSLLERQARRLLEMLQKARLSSLDFDNREHLHVIALCLDTAIDHVEKIK